MTFGPAFSFLPSFHVFQRRYAWDGCLGGNLAFVAARSLITQTAGKGELAIALQYPWTINLRLHSILWLAHVRQSISPIHLCPLPSPHLTRKCATSFHDSIYQGNSLRTSVLLCTIDPVSSVGVISSNVCAWPTQLFDSSSSLRRHIASCRCGYIMSFSVLFLRYIGYSFQTNVKEKFPSVSILQLLEHFVPFCPVLVRILSKLILLFLMNE